MTTGENINKLLNGINWSVGDDSFLSDFVTKASLPLLAAITKGQHLSIGAPNAANTGLRPYVLVHSRQKVRKVIAQVIKDGRNRMTAKEQKVAIPEGFEGFFEILSEEGKPVKCIESVHDLSRKFPDSCLVRGSIRACLPDTDGELRNLNRTRLVSENETLILVGQFNYKRETFLRCFDESGNSIYLRNSQKGRFSPIARKEAITGVHCIKNLLNAKRFPLTVKLVTGSFPQFSKSGSANSPAVLRLQRIILDDMVVMYSLHEKGTDFLSVPLNTHLRLASSINHQEIINRQEFRKLLESCERNLPGYLNRILPYTDPVPTTPNAVAMGGLVNATKNNPVTKEIQHSVPDEEIDQLYDYIRGLAPLPQSCQNTPQHPPPPPPPLETLPSRLSADSRNSAGSPTNPPLQAHDAVKGHGGKKRPEGKHRKKDIVPSDPVQPMQENKRNETCGSSPEHKPKLRKHRHKRTSRSTEKTPTRVPDSVNEEKQDTIDCKDGVKIRLDGAGKAATPPKIRKGKTRPRPVSMAFGDNDVIFFGQQLNEPQSRYDHNQARPKRIGRSSGPNQAFPSATNLYIPDDPGADVRHSTPIKGQVAFVAGSSDHHWVHPVPALKRNQGFAHPFAAQ